MNVRNASPWLFGGIFAAAGVGILYAIKKAGLGAVCQPHIKSGDRVLLVGDSQSQGLKTPLGSLAKKTGIEFQSFTESGTTMGRWLHDAQVSATLASFKPTLVLICLGTNDSAGNYSDEKLASQVVAMRDWIKASGADLVWILPTKLRFPERVSPAVNAAGIDAFPSATLPIPQVDGIHSTGRGYAGWAEHIWAFLSCAPTPQVAMQGLGSAPRVPNVPSFMVPARPPKVRRATVRKRLRRLP